MKYIIKINLRALTEDARLKIREIIDECLNDIEDDINEEAVEDISAFYEN